MGRELNPVSPAALKALPQRTIASGETLRIDMQNNIAIGASVDLPTVYDDNTIVIAVAAGDASSAAITINGNGQTIDGASSCSIDWNRGVIVFARDTQLGEWCRLIQPRQQDGALGLLVKARDVQGVAAASAGFSYVFSPVDLGITMPNLETFNETRGIQFRTDKNFSCKGARIYITAAAAGLTFKATLWASTGPVSLATVTKVAPVTASRIAWDILFDAAYALPRGGPSGTRYVMAVKTVAPSASNWIPAIGTSASNDMPGSTLWPFYMGPGVVFFTWMWTSGDAYPSSPSANTPTAIEPILQYA